MIFTMNAQDLLEGLNTVTRALAARAAKKILEGVLLYAEEDRLTLTCSDGSMSIEYTNVATIQEDGQAVLPGRLLTELIRKMPGGNVTVEVKDQRTAMIRCQKIRSTLAVMDAAEYPDIAEIQSDLKLKIPQNQLKDMISHVMFAVATDESRPILTGCLLEISHSEARLVALDGFRLAMQKLTQPFALPANQEKLRVIVPGRVMNELSHILQDDESFCELLVDQGHIQASFGNIRLSSVLLAGEFIDYRRIISNDQTTVARADRIAVLDAIDRASLMAREGKNNLIRMSFRKNVLRITSNAEMGNVEEEVEVDLQGDDIDIAFNAKYIIDMIRNVRDEKLIMRFKSNVSPCIVTPTEGDRYLYLILPVRVFQ